MTRWLKQQKGGQVNDAAMMQRRPIYRVFMIPLLLFVVGMSGLIAALLFSGLADLIASLAVGLPVFIVFWIVLLRRRYRNGHFR